MACILLDVDGVLHVSGEPIPGAAEAVARLRPDVAIPIHWGTLWPVAMRWRRHRLSEPPLQLEAEVRRRNLPSRVVILAPGEAYALPPRTGAP